MVATASAVRRCHRRAWRSIAWSPPGIVSERTERANPATRSAKRAELLGEAAAELRQRLIANVRAHVLVDRAEVVDVQVQQHQRRRARIGGVDHPLQVGFAGTQAGQAGQVGVLGVQAGSGDVAGADP